MSIQVTITDTEALRALSWTAVKAYLDAADGWQRADEIPNKAIMYQHTDENGRLREISVLTRDDLADYAARMGDAVGTLARVEDRSELDVYVDLQRLSLKMAPSVTENATSSPPIFNEATRAVHKQIRQWLVEEGWHVEDVPVPLESFNVVALQSDGRAVNIFQPNDVLDHVALSLRWSYDRVRQLVGDIDDGKFGDLKWNIYRDTSLMGVDIYDTSDSKSDMILRAHVYFDGLTKDTLMQKVQLVNRAYALAMRMSIRAQEAPGLPAGRTLSPDDVRRIMRPIAEAAGPITVAS